MTADLLATRQRISTDDLTARMADAIEKREHFADLFRQTGSMEHFNAFTEWRREYNYLLDTKQRYEAARAGKRV